MDTLREDLDLLLSWHVVDPISMLSLVFPELLLLSASGMSTEHVEVGAFS